MIPYHLKVTGKTNCWVHSPSSVSVISVSYTHLDVYKRQIQHCYRLYATVAASGINLMKASMDEKLNLVMTLKASIDRARYIIDNANLYCFLVTDCGWKPDYIWEILNSNVKNEIAERVINKWNQGYAG